MFCISVIVGQVCVVAAPGVTTLGLGARNVRGAGQKTQGRCYLHLLFFPPFHTFNRLTGPLPAAWAGMGSLRKLVLSENNVTGALPPDWGTGMPQLQELWLEYNEVRVKRADSATWGQFNWDSV